MRTNINLNLDDEHIQSVMKNSLFIDIETSLLDARVFRTGTQYIGADQLSNETRLLTVAGGTFYDLYTNGMNGMFGFGNHQSPTFESNPLDDTFLLRRLWDILDGVDTVVAHNAKFDTGWINGRFLELGWPLPSKYKVVCTYKALRRFNLTSKRLDQLSRTLVGNKKIKTDFSLWNRCSDGEVSAFEEMMKYNFGDVYNTLFQVYMHIAPFCPDQLIDMVDYTLPRPQCKVDGSLLEELDDVFVNTKNGEEYALYENTALGIQYRDRYNINSSKSGLGLLVHHI